MASCDRQTWTNYQEVSLCNKWLHIFVDDTGNQHTSHVFLDLRGNVKLFHIQNSDKCCISLLN